MHSAILVVLAAVKLQGNVKVKTRHVCIIVCLQTYLFCEKERIFGLNIAIKIYQFQNNKIRVISSSCISTYLHWVCTIQY